MLSILHLSDLHFGPPYLPRIGDAVLSIAPDLAPDAIVVSGDLTQRAKPEQFMEARAFLEKLPDVPKLVIPGNHDVPLFRVAERLSDPHKYYRQYISNDLDQVLRMPQAVLVGVDSTAPRRAISNGRLGMDKLDQTALMPTARTFRVVDTSLTDD